MFQCFWLDTPMEHRATSMPINHERHCSSSVCWGAITELYLSTLLFSMPRQRNWWHYSFSRDILVLLRDDRLCAMALQTACIQVDLEEGWARNNCCSIWSFSPAEPNRYSIQCYPHEKALQKPRNLMKLEKERQLSLKKGGGAQFTVSVFVVDRLIPLSSCRWPVPMEQH